MTDAAGISEKTNHSARKTAIQTLLHADVAPTAVMQLSGHKNIQSLNSYSHLSIDQQRKLSNVLASSSNYVSTAHPSNLPCPAKVQPSSQTQRMTHGQDDISNISDLQLDASILNDLLNDEFLEPSIPDKIVQPPRSHFTTSAIPVPITFSNCTFTGNVVININNHTICSPANKKLKMSVDHEKIED